MMQQRLADTVEQMKIARGTPFIMQRHRLVQTTMGGMPALLTASVTVQDMQSSMNTPHVCLSSNVSTYSSVLAVAGDVPVIVVGGGASLCGDALEGASTAVRPAHAAVANAIGAAIPQARPACG